MISVNGMTVLATQGRGHTPEELTDMMMRKVMSVSEMAPQPIRDQAEAFQDRLRVLALHYLKQAVRSDRTTLYNLLRANGHEDVAKLILDREI